MIYVDIDNDNISYSSTDSNLETIPITKEPMHFHCDLQQ